MEHGVYVMRNDFHKEGIYKIGKTIHTANHRAKQIERGETGTPGLMREVAFYPCSDPERLERMLHRHFREQRCDPKREFFEVSPETVTEAVHKLMNLSYQFSVETDALTRRIKELEKQVQTARKIMVKATIEANQMDCENDRIYSDI